MKEVLRRRIGEDASLAYSSMDVIGDIVVVKVPRELLEVKEEVGKAVLEVQKTARAVYRQVGAISGSHRTMGLEFLAGEPGTETMHREHDCTYLLDISEVYFSPRLAHERKRISGLVASEETIINMFAGVGPYSILIAKEHPEVTVYSIDINHHAVGYHRKNSKINKVYDRVQVFQGDAREIVEDSLADQADRILLPYPELTLQSLKSAVRGLRRRGWIHAYLHCSYTDFQEEALRAGSSLVEETLREQVTAIEDLQKTHVRDVETRTSQICIDVCVRR